MNAHRVLHSARAAMSFLLLVALCLMLSSCGGGGDTRDIYQRIYSAIDAEITDIRPAVVRREGSLDSPDRRLLVKEADAGQLKAIVNAINAVAAEETVRLAVEYSDLDGIKGINCGGLALTVCGGVNYEALASIPNLTELNVILARMEEGEVIPFIEALPKLIVTTYDNRESPTSRNPASLAQLDFQQLQNCTGMETLELRANKYVKSAKNMDVLKTMTALNSVLLMSNMSSAEPWTFPGEMELVEYLKALPGLETINGTPASEYDIFAHMDEAAWNELQTQNAKKEASDFLREALRKADDDEYDTVDDTSINGLVMIDIQGTYDSLSSAFQEKDYHGIPLAKLAAAPDQCSEVIIVYTTTKFAGLYTNGASGLDRMTWARVVHVKSGTMSEPYLVKTNRAPQTKGVASSGRVSPTTTYTGDMATEEAIEYIKGLLGVNITDED